jgi:hypothetical protein
MRKSTIIAALLATGDIVYRFGKMSAQHVTAEEAWRQTAKQTILFGGTIILLGILGQFSLLSGIVDILSYTLIALLALNDGGEILQSIGAIQ